MKLTYKQEDKYTALLIRLGWLPDKGYHGDKLISPHTKITYTMGQAIRIEDLTTDEPE